MSRLLFLAGLRVASGTCEDVWFVEGLFLGEKFTCGERIVYLQSPQGGLYTEQDARVKTALEDDKCADCWPWQKYREDGEVERSSKRGVAIENYRLTPESLNGLSKVVTWGKTWDFRTRDGPSLDVWNMAGLDFVPMVWGDATIEKIKNETAEGQGMEGDTALLGFNEPNFPNQADLTPSEAAARWPQLEELARENNITTIVSPQMNWHWSKDPIEWLQEFFAACDGCKVDAIGLHVFACYANGLKYHLDRYRIFGKPMWITEIACSDPYNPQRLSAEGQMAYMREAIPLLEADEDVAKYAWFSYFKDEWKHPIVDGENGDAGLIYPNGTLTPLGKLYTSFAAGSNLTEINITVPVRNDTNATVTTSEMATASTTASTVEVITVTTAATVATSAATTAATTVATTAPATTVATTALATTAPATSATTQQETTAPGTAPATVATTATTPETTLEPTTTESNATAGGGLGGPQFACLDELEEGGGFPLLFLLLAMIAAGMLGSALTALWYDKRWRRCRKKEEKVEDLLQSDLKRCLSGEHNWLGVMGKGTTSRVAPDPGLLLPQAVAERAGDSPKQMDVRDLKIGDLGELPARTLLEGSANVKGGAAEMAQMPAVVSRQAAAQMLLESIEKTAALGSLEEKEASLEEANRLLHSSAARQLPEALRQDVETWHSRQEEQLNVARSMEASGHRAEAVAEAVHAVKAPDDLMTALLAQAKVEKLDGVEENLTAAHRASVLQDLERLKLEKQQNGKQSLPPPELMDRSEELLGLEKQVKPEQKVLAKATQEVSTEVQETSEKKKPKRDFGCQTVFRLGGMAWHSNPAIQKLLEELLKVSGDGPGEAEQLDEQVTEIMKTWRKDLDKSKLRRSRSVSKSRLEEVKSEAPAEVKDQPVSAEDARRPPSGPTAARLARAEASELSGRSSSRRRRSRDEAVPPVAPAAQPPAAEAVSLEPQPPEAPSIMEPGEDNLEQLQETPVHSEPQVEEVSRGGPGDGSLLVPPAESRSPSVSSAGSSPGRPRRLDPLVRPRGPPLPSAGRLLMASQQEGDWKSPRSR